MHPFTRSWFSTAALALTLLTCLPATAMAHFGMAIPSAPEATADTRNLDVTFSFSHPFGGQGMELVKPEAAFVVREGERTDLLPALKETKVMEHKAWSVDYAFKRPGAHTFAMVPKPYWEPAEDCFIVHYTKVVVPAFGGDAGWDEAVGLPTEIVPLLRPFGNYAGNSFVGRVLRDGKPLANAEVEVELYNQDGYAMPSDYHETQVVLADENGVFTFTCPVAGWWGFAALSTADEQLTEPSSGEKKDIELGAIIWTYLHPWSK